MKLPCINPRTIRLPRRVCGVALLLVFWSNAAPAAQEPLSWPNRPPYVRVTNGEEVVLMPVAAARAAQRRLNMPPDHWGMALGTRAPYAGRRQRIVELYADTDEWVSFLATRRSWNLLTDQNVACLNKVLERVGHDLVKSGFDDQQKRREYLGRLDEVVIGMSITLDDEFIRLYFTGSGATVRWLGGREKCADVLLRLCHNVVVTRQGRVVTFTYNRMRSNGSVVRRTVHARVAGHRLELLRLETVELRSAGTFSYPTLI